MIKNVGITQNKNEAYNRMVDRNTRQNEEDYITKRGGGNTNYLGKNRETC